MNLMAKVKVKAVVKEKAEVKAKVKAEAMLKDIGTVKEKEKAKAEVKVKAKAMDKVNGMVKEKAAGEVKDLAKEKAQVMKVDEVPLEVAIVLFTQLLEKFQVTNILRLALKFKNAPQRNIDCLIVNFLS